MTVGAARTIWKYPLKIAGRQEILMPIGSVILHVRDQDDAPCLWVYVYPNAALVPRTFVIYGTGHGIVGDVCADDYVGTVHCNDGTLVWHIFEPGHGY